MHDTTLRAPQNREELETLVETLLEWNIKKPSGHVPQKHQAFAKMLMRAYGTQNRAVLERFVTAPDLTKWLEEIEEDEDWEYLAGLLYTHKMPRAI